MIDSNAPRVGTILKNDESLIFSDLGSSQRGNNSSCLLGWLVASPQLGQHLNHLSSVEKQACLIITFCQFLSFIFKFCTFSQLNHKFTREFIVIIYQINHENNTAGLVGIRTGGLRRQRMEGKDTSTELSS